MRVTLLGHASVLVEAQGRSFLVDPVFSDPFGEGAVASCPARTVDVERLPKIDVLVLTSAEPDHFDVATVAKLSRACVVVCPKHPSILYVLEKLGFMTVRATDPGTLLKFGKVDLLTTPSARPELELGVLVKDRTGTFWHAGDTALSPTVIEHARALVGRVHLLFAAYAVQGFGYYGSQRAGYPVSALRAAIATVRAVAPVMVVPGSAGFRFVEPFAWLNAFVFPISRERFLGDLARVAPEIARAPGNPGDVFEIGDGAVRAKPGESTCATMVRDDTSLIAFDPTSYVPPLNDPNCEQYPDDVLDETVDEAIDALVQFVLVSYAASSDSLVEQYRESRSIYGLGVVFPGGRERWLRIRFEPEAPTIERGDGPIRGALFTHRIAASGIVARARNEKTYHFTLGLSRLSLVTPASLKGNDVVIEPRERSDLLLYSLTHRPPGPAAHQTANLDHQLAPFVETSKA